MIIICIDTAPEYYFGGEFDYSLDFWSLGCILYELLFGETPFPRDELHPIYEVMHVNSKVASKASESLVKFPDSSHSRKITSYCKDVISRLLIIHPSERLGSHHGAQDIKCHNWFKEIATWNAVTELELIPPWIPSEEDLENEENQEQDEEIHDLPDDLNSSPFHVLFSHS